MYELGVMDNFICQHFLIGNDVGSEGVLHSHNYKITIILTGSELNEDGYLVDICKVQDSLNSTVSFFKDKCLNDLKPFKGLNPSIEHFSRIFFTYFMEYWRNPPNISGVSVEIWEDDIGYAKFKQKIE